MFWKRLFITFEGKVIVLLGMSLILFLLNAITPIKSSIDNDIPIFFVVGIVLVISTFVGSIIRLFFVPNWGED